jgi:hypothetical protein
MSSGSRNNIQDAARGLIVYDTTDQRYYFYNNGWQAMSGESHWANDTADNIHYTMGNVGIGTIQPQKQLQLEGLMQTRMNSYSFRLDTSAVHGFPVTGAYLYKNIDSSRFMASGILDASAVGGPKNLYTVNYSNQDSGKQTGFSVREDYLQLNVNDEQKQQATGIGLEPSGASIIASDPDFNKPYSSFNTSRSLLRMVHKNDQTETTIDADSLSASIVYSEQASASGSGKMHKFSVNNTGIEMQLEDSTNNVPYLHFSMSDGLVVAGKGQSSKIFTVKDSADTDVFYLKNDGQAWFEGNVGIAESSPSEKLHVDGNILASGSITENSDARLKEDIHKLESALDKVNNLRGVRYEWSDPQKTKGKRLGLIAQEVEEVYPELVGEDNHGNKHLHYTGLIGPVIEAVKQLSEENEELEKENEQLRSAIEELRNGQQGLRAELEAIKEQLIMEGRMSQK